jgi:hypothetical protein
MGGIKSQVKSHTSKFITFQPEPSLQSTITNLQIFFGKGVDILWKTQYIIKS